MSVNTIESQLEQSMEKFQKMLQLLLDNQVQVQQWTENVLEEQAKQWKILNEQVQKQQKQSYEQFEEMLKLVNEIKPSIDQTSFEANWKKLLDQFAPFQAFWATQNQNPYQVFFQSMTALANQQQQIFQQFTKQPLNNPVLSGFNTYYEQFQKSQEEWLKQLRDLPFTKF